MRRITSFTPLEDAVKGILSHVKVSPRVEEIWVWEGFGRVLAEDVVPEVTVPPYDSSHVDGYAVRSSDVAGASPSNPIRLRVVGVAAAGEKPHRRINPGEAYRVLTGGYLPDGADAVIQQEDVSLSGGFIEVSSPVEPGANVDRAGRDAKAGSKLLGRGHRIGAQDVGLLLRVGVRRVKVYSRPVVGVMSVGSELTDNLEEEGKTLNTHRYSIELMLKAAGAQPRYLGLAPDEVEAIRSMIMEGLNSCDMVLVIGGSSVSERDLVAEILREMNPSIFLQGVKLQPGRVVGYAVIGGKPVVMLPGHILSAISAYTFLAYPVIRMLQGLSPKPYALKARARLASGIRHGRWIGFKRIVWVRVEEAEDGLVAEPRMGEASLYSVAVRSDAYTLIPEGVEEVPEGSIIDIYFIPGINHLM